MVLGIDRTQPRELFTAVNIGSLRLANRIVMPAIHLCFTPEGFVTDTLIDFYVERAAGGAGLIIVGGCPVDEYGGGRLMVGLSHDQFVPGLTRLAQAVHKHGVPLAAQLYHAGRYSLSTHIGRQPLAPSAVRSSLTRETPREMTTEDIHRTIHNFADAASRAKIAGFDAVEISASAGYLLSQFLSPVTNLRQDEYGGSLEEKMRFPLEVVRAVRTEVGPDYPIIIRIAGNDFVKGGNTNREARLLAKELERAGVDAINVTGGWHETRVPQITMAVPRGAFSYLARGVKQVVNIPVISSNRYSDPLLADQMLRHGIADMIAMGRPLIADPELPRKAKEGRLDEILHCVACNQGCFDHIFALQPVSCLVNPRAGRERTYMLEQVASPKRVIIIGGGPAGMEVAATAASRRHQVILFEKDDRLGGQLSLASVAPGREELETLVVSLCSQLQREGVEVKLGQEASVDLVLASGADAVVVATGAEPIVPEIPGVESEHVVQAWDVLAAEVDVGERITVLGGGATGCLVALYLAQMGTIDAPTLRFLMLNRAETWKTLEELGTRGVKSVTLVEMLPKLGKDIGLTTRWTVLQDLQRCGVETVVNATVKQVLPHGVMVVVDQQDRLIEADTVVLAAGVSSRNSLYEELKDRVNELHLIGDAKRPRKAYDAMHEGFEVGMAI
ncbi:MAG: NADH:flavin oxidoreductase [Chloroflexi bacterium B3_Chlor]|nr:MAG: NADH:flavin oxidoreductase [Chloroflexi bacterium B3_Chlor]